MRAKIEAEKRAKEGEKHHKKKLGYEAKEEWEKEEERRKKRDEERAYHKARSAEIGKVKAGVARARKAEEVIEKLNRLIEELNRRHQPPGQGLHAGDRLSLPRRDRHREQSPVRDAGPVRRHAR